MTFPVLGANGAVAGYSIDNSLRFNDDDSAYLSRTPASAGNRKTWTWSGWVKRGNFGINTTLFAAGSSSTNQTKIRFVDSNESILFDNEVSGSTTVRYFTSNLFRDPSAWYHFVFAVDTTQASDVDKVKMYVNGEQITSFSATPNYPSLNEDLFVNNTDVHYIGRELGTGYLDGYLADVYFIDGQQLSPTDFGEFDEDSGIWKPIEYTGTYGTNGFYLDFEDSGSLGADQSGNGNNFTPTNLASTDQTTDTPTNNFATMNPLGVTSAGTATFSEGNCQVATVVVGSMGGYCNINFPSSGKWYCEAKITTSSPSNAYIGVVEYSATDSNSFTNGDSTFYYGNGDKYVNGSTSSYGSAWSQNDIIGMAVNADDNQITFYLNGSSQGVLSETIEGKTWNAGDTSGGVSHTFQWNFGNPVHSISSGNSDGNGYGNFEYAPPSGYLALCTQNLATELSPTIDDGSQYFNTVLYTGTGSSQGITGVGFQPDFTWIKIRNTVDAHGLVDSTRGATKHLRSDSNASEFTRATDVSSFDSDGFTVVSDAQFNGSGNTYASWNWKANGGTTSSNTDGDETTTVQASTTSGFSIITYQPASTLSDQTTIGHGLGSSPDFLIYKNRDTTSHWIVYPMGISGQTDQAGFLSLTDAFVDANILGQGYFDNPTSTTIRFRTGSSGSSSGGSTDKHLIYAFKSINGYSSFGSYTGNGSSDGTFIYTGFRPAFVIFKRTDSADSWTMFDSTRDIDNYVEDTLAPDLPNAETDGFDEMDFLSNGIKLRRSTGGRNASGSTYIYMAFAESPFVTSSGVPVVAR